MLGRHPEDPQDTDTADGRPATRKHAHARLSRMLCSDPELMSEEAAADLAWRIDVKILETLRYNVRTVAGRVKDRDGQERGWLKARDVRVIASGSGEFVAQRLLEPEDIAGLNPFPVFLSDKLGPAVAACAPAYALAVLATERRP